MFYWMETKQNFVIGVLWLFTFTYDIFEVKFLLFAVRNVFSMPRALKYLKKSFTKNSSDA